MSNISLLPRVREERRVRDSVVAVMLAIETETETETETDQASSAKRCCLHGRVSLSLTNNPHRAAPRYETRLTTATAARCACQKLTAAGGELPRLFLWGFN